MFSHPAVLYFKPVIIKAENWTWSLPYYIYMNLLQVHGKCIFIYVLFCRHVHRADFVAETQYEFSWAGKPQFILTVFFICSKKKNAMKMQVATEERNPLRASEGWSFLGYTANVRNKLETKKCNILHLLLKESNDSPWCCEYFLSLFGLNFKASSSTRLSSHASDPQVF